MVAASCELLFPGVAEPVAVPVESGTVTIDRTAESRRTGHVTIPWSGEIAEDLGIDIRTLPLGGYALVRRGIRYPDGTSELVLLGRLRVESVSWGTLDTTADLELADRMAQVRDEPFVAPFLQGHGPGDRGDRDCRRCSARRSPTATRSTRRR